MNVAIVIFPGTNRERDVAWAATSVMGAAVHFVWHKEAALGDTDLVILPGGFSHGDYLRSGAIAALSPIMRAVHTHATRGGYVLGICNGFQTLTECGLLPGALARNAGLRFVSHDCHIMAERCDTMFTGKLAPGAALRAPLAHGDGNYVSDAATLDRLEAEGRVAFRYCDEAGRRGPDANPNGSARDIAGVFSRNLRVLGLMPHLENCIDPALGSTEGRAFFEGLVAVRAPEPAPETT